MHAFIHYIYHIDHIVCTHISLLNHIQALSSTQHLWKNHNGPGPVAVSQFGKRGILTDNVSEQDHMAKVASNPQVSLSQDRLSCVLLETKV